MPLDPRISPRILRNLGSLTLAFLIWAVLNMAHALEDKGSVFGLLYTLETSLVDLRFDWRGEQSVSDDIVIVAIDTPSVESMGRWPWSRHELARLVEALGEAGAKVVAFDILFSEPETDEADQALARAMESGPAVVLPYRWLDRRESRQRPTSASLGSSTAWRELLLTKSPVEGEALVPWNCPRSLPFGSTALVLPLARASTALGFANYPQDRHGKARRAWLTRAYATSAPSLFPAGSLTLSEEETQERCGELEVQGTLVSLPTAAVALFRDNPPQIDYRDRPFGQDWFLEIAGEAPNLESVELRLDPWDLAIAIDYYGPSQTFLTHSYRDVMACPSDDCLRDGGGNPLARDRAFEGKLVFVGVTDPGSYDSFPTPTDATFSGVEMQATVAQNLLDGRQLRQAQDEVLQTAGTSLVAALLAALMICNLGILPSSAALAVIATLFISFTARAFEASSTVWNWTIPLLTLLSVHASVSIFCALHENYQRRRQHSAFVRYLSKPAIDAILADPDGVHFGRRELDATVLFLDLADFESLAEQVRDRRQLIRPLNSYLSRVIQVFLDEADDTVIKFFGHGVMAVFVDSGHAATGCRAASKIPATLAELRVELEAWGLLSQGLACRIGISSGEVVIGNVGSRRLMDYTVLGETVDRSIRLQGEALRLECEILVTEGTRQQAIALDKDLIFRPVATETNQGRRFELLRRSDPL